MTLGGQNFSSFLDIKTTVIFVPLQLTSVKAQPTAKDLCQRGPGGAGVGIPLSCNLTSDKKCLWLRLDIVQRNRDCKQQHSLVIFLDTIRCKGHLDNQYRCTFNWGWQCPAAGRLTFPQDMLLLRFSKVVFGTHVIFIFFFLRKSVKKYIGVFSCEVLLSSTELNVFLSLGCTW